MAAFDETPRAAGKGNPRIVELGRDYWEHGEGAAKIRWGTKGATRRCHRLLMQHAEMTSEQAWGYCAERHHAVTGTWPGEKGGGKSRRDNGLTPSQERGARVLGDGMDGMDGEMPGTLALDDEWADFDGIPDLTGLTVADLEAADTETEGE